MRAEDYHWRVRVVTHDYLDQWIEEYLGHLRLQHQPDGTTLIVGTLPDSPALYGMIVRLRDSGVALISLNAERNNSRWSDENV